MKIWKKFTSWFERRALDLLLVLMVLLLMEFTIFGVLFLMAMGVKV